MTRRRDRKRPRKGPAPDYVPHPRYGNEPRRTGLDPDPDARDVHLHHNTLHCRTIAGTAVVANLARQVEATVAVTHYYDVERTCRDCARPFLFYADEQKHWYEELRFPIDADCVRCHPCRRQLRKVQAARLRYEELLTRDERTPAEEFELAGCRLQLMEDGLFSASRHLDEVRRVLHRYPDQADAEGLRQRLSGLEEARGGTSA